MKSLCYNLGKEFQSSSHFCPPFCLPLLNFVRVVNHFNFTVLQSISPFCTIASVEGLCLHSISLFCTGEIALIIDLGLIDIFSANQTTEIVACILLFV